MMINRHKRSADFIPNSAFRIPHSRRGFTLIELMVVIAIMIMLASIALLFNPRRDSQLATQGADQLQTYLASARSRALRDQAPRGVRLVPDGLGNFKDVQLIETPEPLQPVGATLTAANPGSTATFTGFNPQANLQRGDMLEITHGAGSIHRITAVAATSVTLATPIPAASVAPLSLTSNFRFIRQPRPLMGEPPLQLPNTVNISATQSTGLPRSFNQSQIEILFSPSGQVINAATGRIVLWVGDDNNVSKPVLVTIYSYTGSVAAHPVGPAATPYIYTQDGKSSGQ